MSQDIQVGDELVGDDGTKRTVIDTISGEDVMYQVTQIACVLRQFALLQCTLIHLYI
jgi:hypothetical protein